MPETRGRTSDTLVGATRPGKAERVQVEGGDEGVEEAHGIFGGDVILQPFGKEQALRAVQSSAMIHPCQTRHKT